MSTKKQDNLIFEIKGGDHVNLIPIFPFGIVKGHDGRGPYNMKDAASVIAASYREHVELVIDRDHQADLAPPGTPVKAAGWIKELVEQDGAIMARVEWTPTAAQELKDKEYRYISPTFEHDKQGNVIRILRATLTNTPNFNMKAVASAQTNNQTDDEPTQENEPMNETLLAIAAALGLASPKNEKEVLDLVTATASELASAKTSLTATAKALGLKEDEKSETIVSTASTIKATADKKGETDASKFVPMDVHNELASSFKTLQDERKAEKAELAVASAMKAGKISPAQKEWAIEYASADPAKFEKYIEGAPVVCQPGEFVDTSKAVASDGKLDETDIALCSALGIKPEDYKKTAQQQ